ncbi:MAG: mevalonate kinase [Deltaproteobacteria bacterium]|nr:MAG: mevalonate kinase [Deltaproteobacteria bacterium]
MTVPPSQGKVILFGEHAVVFGRPAVGLGLPGAMVVERLRPLADHVKLCLPAWNFDGCCCHPGLLGKVLHRLFELLPGRRLGMELSVHSRIPPGAGLGSSAALAVLLVRALARVRGLELDLAEQRRLAHVLEEIFHGRPSGLDDTLACFGGVCLFRRREWSKPLPALPVPARRLSAQALGLECRLPEMVVGYTGREHQTRHMVELVRRRRQRQPQETEVLFAEMERCLWWGLDSLCAGRWAELGLALNSNQQLLELLGVSSPEIASLVQLARRHGALGAKLTGAGGGGAVVALAPGNQREVARAWSRAGHRTWYLDGADDWRMAV